jgi:hypothetical protein
MVTLVRNISAIQIGIFAIVEFLNRNNISEMNAIKLNK